MITEPVATKMVRAADEDDDRRDADGAYVNPRYAALNDPPERRPWEPPAPVTRRMRSGWHCAINVRLRDMREVLETEQTRGCAGFFQAILRTYPNGAWRISCFGSEVNGYARRFTREVDARRVWATLNHHVTIRTLVGRLGFRRE